MTKILESFLSDMFINAFSFIDIIFIKLIDIIFFVENHLSDGSLFENTLTESNESVIFFDNFFKVTSAFAIAFLILKVAKKIFDIYVGWVDGDPNNSIESLILGFIKAIIIILSFPIIYEIFADISIKFIDEILLAVGISVVPNLGTIFGNLFLGKGIFVILGFLIFFIYYIILIFQFITRGLEMFILRVGLPLSTIGLLDSDGGVFTPYIKIFIQNSLTVVVQLAMMKLGFGVLANGNLFFGIGAMIVAKKMPQFLQQFMVGVNVGGINMMQMSASASMIRSISKFVKK